MTDSHEVTGKVVVALYRPEAKQNDEQAPSVRNEVTAAGEAVLLSEPYNTVTATGELVLLSEPYNTVTAAGERILLSEPYNTVTTIGEQALLSALK